MADNAASVVCMVGALESRSSSATGLLGDLGLTLSSFIENSRRMVSILHDCTEGSSADGQSILTSSFFSVK